jgi:glycosyltransferase involved in cell wall biosynthesis
MSDQLAEGLTFLLPVHNQAGILQHALSVWSATLGTIGRPYEIILIDDGSNDATAKLIEGVEGQFGLTQSVPHLRVVRLPERKGCGAAIRAGLEASQYPLIFYSGCEYAYNPVDLKKLLVRLEDIDPESGKKIDLVNGFRSETPVKGLDKLLGDVWRFIVRIVLGLTIPPPMGWLGEKANRYSFWLRILFALRMGDVDSRFKLFRKKIFERIPIQSDGDFVHAEILCKANFLGCLMDELPVCEKPGPFPAHPEPPSPASMGKEFRQLFFHPDFGTATLAAKEPVSGAA